MTVPRSPESSRAAPDSPAVVVSVAKALPAEHGVVCSREDDAFGYFGWPSVARTGDGTLVAVASGLRVHHVCPWGKTVVCFSHDNGDTWTAPRVVNDSPMDDRDAGVVSLGGQRLMLAWFTRDIRHLGKGFLDKLGEHRAAAEAVMATWSDAMSERWFRSFVRVSVDGGGSWGEYVPVPVSAPHGPARLADGSLLYLGKGFPNDFRGAAVQAFASDDEGRTWRARGTVPPAEETAFANFHEPHVVEAASGRLVGMIRYEYPRGGEGAYERFSLFQTESDDGGERWTRARPLGLYGSPPHLLRHSSGALVCSYGYRREPFGQRVAISRDDGATWEADWILRDDGPDHDLGYPCTVELGDGRLLTVYYQKISSPSAPCSLLRSRWKLPDRPRPPSREGNSTHNRAPESTP